MEFRPLIFSASIGHGHNQAATALQQEFWKKGYFPEIIDTFYELNPVLHKFMLSSYLKLLKHGPRVWRNIYLRAEEYPLFLYLDRFGLLFADHLHKIISREACPFIISTHPFVTAFLTSLKRKKQLMVPLYTVITDFVLHPAYLRPEVNGYFTIDPNCSDFAKLHNVPSDRFFSAGIPIITDQFINKSKWKARYDLGLEQDKKTLLIAGGGMGLTKYMEVIRCIDKLNKPIQVLCMVGHNYKAKEKIKLIKSNHDIKIVEFTQNFLLYLKASDAILSKAGGLTMAESLACETPIVIFHPVPGHEEQNAQFLVDSGAAIMPSCGKEIPDVINRVLYEKNCYSQLRKNAKKLKKPDAARNIVHEIIKLEKQQRENIHLSYS
ncbi:MGDG synthase family glycosyltransferase [Evansella clarkii]|uniref:MGDG synthase family glycosyltransferase n=1 Tax=Evansella clarkii TaxID=79879 RepID=UPI000998DC27|nr:glycosyltransferase [Evansella clarkii]